MRSTTCQHCGSSEFRVSDYRPKDFPRKFYFIECTNCGTSGGVVDIHNAIDAFRGDRSMGKKLASDLFSRNSPVEV